jgi:hypothetical protein
VLLDKRRPACPPRQTIWKHIDQEKEEEAALDVTVDARDAAPTILREAGYYERPGAAPSSTPACSEDDAVDGALKITAPDRRPREIADVRQASIADVTPRADPSRERRLVEATRSRAESMNKDPSPGACRSATGHRDTARRLCRKLPAARAAMTAASCGPHKRRRLARYAHR